MHQGKSAIQSHGIHGHVWWGMLCGQVVVVYAETMMQPSGLGPTVRDFELFDFFGMKVAWMAVEKAKVRRRSNVAGCYRSGLVYCFHVSASQS